MSCTTMLVGKKASNDNSTMIARTDDGHFDVKKLVIVKPSEKATKYKSVLSHVEIELPAKGMKYTSCPSVDKKDGIWAATGINEANVGMTATETITSNPRVLAADPLVKYEKAKGGKKEVKGGIGEEDIVVLVLPYIKSAREGVKRLAMLLEKYGTYESNGIAFNDRNEVWWMETIGGHHWIASRVRDDECVINPNQFGMDRFDLKDALGDQKEYMCSKDLMKFIKDNHLDLNREGDSFNPRYVFGSRSDQDHVYNTPRAWFMGRYLTPFSHKWDGADAEFGPESDNIPWSLKPDKKVAAEDVAYILSSYYQGTPYNPYTSHDTGMRGMYRSIGINRTGVTSICQIREDVPDALRGVEWICFGSTAFGCFVPVYTAVDRIPAYLKNVTLDTDTGNLYWASRLIAALADAHYASNIQHIDRYKEAVFTEGRRIMLEYDRKMIKAKKYDLTEEANEEICKMARKETTKVLNNVLLETSTLMKNGYNRADN